MSEFMESTGKTVDEAIREALLRMGLRREEVEVTVIQRDRGGLLGIGRRQAVVRVERKSGAKRGGSSSDGDRGGSRRRGGGGSGGDARGERLDGGQDRGGRGGRGRRSSGGRGRQDGDQSQESRGGDQGGRGRGRDGDTSRDGDNQGRGSRGGRGRGRGRGRDSEQAPVQAKEESRTRTAPQPQNDDRSRRQESENGEDGRTRRRRRSRRRGRKPAAEVESAVTNPAGDGKVFGGDAPRDQESPRAEAPRREESPIPEPVRDERRAPEPVIEATPEPRETPAEKPVRNAAPAAATAGNAIVEGQVALSRVAAFTAEDVDPLDGFLERVATGLMVKSGFPCRVQVKDGEYQQVKLVVDDRSAGVLIGRHGATVDAVEYLVAAMASQAVGDRVRMNLDINNYRLRRHDSIEERARNAAAEARNTGEPVKMAPMHGRERRLVHLEIEEMDDLVTYTEDSYDGKYVVICRPDQVPAESAPSTGRGDEDTEPAKAEPRTMAAAEADSGPTETAAVITDDADDLDDEEPRHNDD